MALVGGAAEISTWLARSGGKSDVGKVVRGRVATHSKMPAIYADYASELAHICLASV